MGVVCLFTLFFRAMILYAVMIATMRVMGRRQLGEFQPYEFALTILLADLISSPMESVSTPLLHGLIPMAALIVLHGSISVLSLKSDRLRAFLSGKPVVVISQGEIDQEQLEKLCLSLSDLLEGLREAGMLNPAEVGTAIFEADGKITAFPSGDARPPTTRELGIDPGREGLPLALVMDGRVQKHNLRQAGHDLPWLQAALEAQGLQTADAYLATLDTQGQMTVQRKGGGIVRFSAEKDGKVAW